MVLKYRSARHSLHSKYLLTVGGFFFSFNLVGTPSLLFLEIIDILLRLCINVRFVFIDGFLLKSRACPGKWVRLVSLFVVRGLEPCRLMSTIMNTSNHCKF